MTSTPALVSRHPLIAFFAIAYALTWLGWILPGRIYAGTLLSGALALVFLLMVPGPLYAALIVTAITGGKPGVLALLRRFTIWRVGWGWFAVVLLMAPVICVTPA
jgi:CAAX protease family protein